MDNETERPSWTDYFKSLTLLTATRSSCMRLHVGCILVKDNRIISQGYNGFLPGCAHKSILREGHEMATVHAEQNAVTDCAKRGVSCDGAAAYITHYPCIHCMKILCAAGVNSIRYVEDYNNDELVAHFATQMLVKLEQI